MRTCLTALLLSVAAVPLLADNDPEPPGDMSKDLKALQGTWQVKSLTAPGVGAVPADALKMSLTFTKDKVKAAAQGNDEKEHSFKIDARKSPKHMDITEKGGKPTRGIYKIVDGELHIALHAKADQATRPVGFDGKETVVMVLKKAKK